MVQPIEGLPVALYTQSVAERATQDALSLMEVTFPHTPQVPGQTPQGVLTELFP